MEEKKFTQGQLVMAFAPVMRLNQQSISREYSKKIYQLKKSLEAVLEYQRQEEEKLLEKYGGHVEPDNVTVSFAGDDEEEKRQRMINYAKARKELLDTESVAEITPFTIPKDVPVEISGEDMEKLEGIITFE